MTMDDKFIKKLLANMKCGICGEQYESANVTVLGHREDLWFLSVFCTSCKSQGIVAAVIKEGSKQAEVITELTEEELARFSSIPSVSSDDVLDMYSFLEEFGGDFSSLFEDE